MKTNIFTILAFIICYQIQAQNLNVEIAESNQTPYLIGKIDKIGLEGDNYKTWFTENYSAYQPNTSIASTIKSELKNYSIKVFMGTWCGDSKREVPRLYKILEDTNFPMDQLTVIALSREPDMYKQSPQHEEAGLNIHRVPTIILYKDGIEVNRIVEQPVKSLEEDIQNIISINDYKSNYQIVTAIDNIIKHKGVRGLKRKQKKLLKIYKDKVTSMYELNTYGRILFGTNRIEEAIAVFKFNTVLFPEEPRTYMSLANTLGVNGNKEDAIEVLEKAIKMHPNDASLEQNLEVIKSN